MTGGVGFRIEAVYAYLAVHDDGDEGVVGAEIGGVFMPLVAADVTRLEQLRPYAQLAATAGGVPIRLVRFERRVDVATIDPA